MSDGNGESAAEAPVLMERNGAVLRLVLNRVRSGNSLSTAVIGTLQSIFDQTADDTGVRVIVISARGNVFCSGHDLREVLANGTPQFSKHLATICNRMMQTIHQLPQPVIASVDSSAIGFPAGTVTFTANGTTFGSQPVGGSLGNTATVSWTPTAAGAPAIVAAFAASDGSDQATATKTVTVSRVDTVTTITTPGTAATNTAVTLSALVRSRDGSYVPTGGISFFLPRGQYQGFPFHQRHRGAFLQGSRTNFWALRVQQRGQRPPHLLLHATYLLQVQGMGLVRPVAEVKPRHIHPRRRHGPKGIVVTTGRTQGTDDLSSTHGHPSRSRPPHGASIPEPSPEFSWQKCAR